MTTWPSLCQATHLPIQVIEPSKSTNASERTLRIRTPPRILKYRFDDPSLLLVPSHFSTSSTFDPFFLVFAQYGVRD